MVGSEKVKKHVDMMRSADIPISALWIQDWCGSRVSVTYTRMWWNWEVDYNIYPDWDTLIEGYKNVGIRVMTYINPFLTDVSKKNNYRNNYYREAKDNGYFLVDKNRNPLGVSSLGFTGYMLDFSNVEAKEWLKSVARIVPGIT